MRGLGRLKFELRGSRRRLEASGRVALRASGRGFRDQAFMPKWLRAQDVPILHIKELGSSTGMFRLPRRACEMQNAPGQRRLRNEDFGVAQFLCALRHYSICFPARRRCHPRH